MKNCQANTFEKKVSFTKRSILITRENIPSILLLLILEDYHSIPTWYIESGEGLDEFQALEDTNPARENLKTRISGNLRWHARNTPSPCPYKRSGSFGDI